MRRGFTLIEMLVATGIFVIGCVAVFSLFIAAMRFRKQADDTIRLSVASTSLLERIRMTAGTETGAPLKPERYVGDGFAGNGPEPATPVASPTAVAEWTDQLFESPDAPGVWYRVLSAVGDDGQPDTDNSTTLRLDILLVHISQSQDPTAFTFDDLKRVIRPKLATTDMDEYLSDLTVRGMITRVHSTIVRRASWDGP